MGHTIGLNGGAADVASLGYNEFAVVRNLSIVGNTAVGNVHNIIPVAGNDCIIYFAAGRS